mmetsp:Transcript_94863/g.192922  ORF Transcript_94863/g.192922 Transcript_94863/m.192922 type:complete len:296 (+) Transcript_94863:420-1307(+)
MSHGRRRGEVRCVVCCVSDSIRIKIWLICLGLDGGLQSIDGRLEFLLGDDQRGDEPNNVGSGWNQQQALVHGGRDEFPGGDVLGNAFDSLEQSPAADVSQNGGVLGGHRLESLGQLLAPFLDVREDVVVADVLGNGQSGCAGEGVSSVRAGVVAGSEGSGGVAAGHHGADRNTAAEGLGGSEDVGDDSEVFVSPQGPGASHTGLNLVDDQQGTGLVAQCTRLGKKLGVSGNDTTLSLERLEHDCGEPLSVRCRLGDGLLEGGNVVVGAGLESLDHLSVVSESLVVLGLLRGGEGR